MRAVRKQGRDYKTYIVQLELVVEARNEGEVLDQLVTMTPQEFHLRCLRNLSGARVVGRFRRFCRDLFGE